MAEVVRISGLTICRGQAVILHEVDWTIRAGEQWVILGANGSGKTSLLNTLSGYLQPTEGEIEVFGEVFGESDWNELRKIIGVVNHTVADWINGAETALEIVVGGIHGQINYWGKISRQDRETALSILEKYGLAYAADRTWQQLSQGERQRVLICRAILAKFRLLILDEPCAGLDPVARAAFLRFVDELANERPKTPQLLLVTHHVEEITPGFTHVLVMKRGRIFAAGPKSRVLTSTTLSDAFEADVRLRKRGNSHFLELSPLGGAEKAGNPGLRSQD